MTLFLVVCEKRHYQPAAEVIEAENEEQAARKFGQVELDDLDVLYVFPAEKARKIRAHIPAAEPDFEILA